MSGERPCVTSGITACLLALGGCGDGLDQDSSGVSRWDSGGVKIVETPVEVARAALEWRIEAEFQTRIGCATGPPDYLFSDFNGVAQLADGGWFVVASDPPFVRVFDAAGSIDTTFGREGQGPGEFQHPHLVNAPNINPLILYDRRLRRFSAFDSLGMFQTVVEGAWQYKSLPVAALGERVLSIWAPYVVGIEPGSRTAPYEFWLSDWTGASAVQLPHIPPRHIFRAHRDAVIRGRSIPRIISNPYQTTASAAVGAALYVTTSLEPEILEFDGLGRLLRIFRVEEFQRPLSRAEFRRVTEELIQQGKVPQAAQSEYTRMPIPSTTPVYSELLVDSEGWIWAGVFDPLEEQPERWMLFDRTGVARGTVVIPSNLTLTRVGRNFIAGINRDEFGVPRLFIHHLSRSSPKSQSPNALRSPTPPRCQ